MFQLAEVLVLPRKEGNADGDTGTDLQATLGTWLAHLGSAGIGDACGVSWASRLSQGRDLGWEQGFWVFMLMRVVVGP